MTEHVVDKIMEAANALSEATKTIQALEAIIAVKNSTIETLNRIISLQEETINLLEEKKV